MSIKRIASIMAIFFLVGCSTMQNEWDIVSKNNDIESYKKFVSKYPNSEYGSLANEKIEKLNFDKAKDDPKSLEDFLKKYPSGKYSEEAKNLLADFKKEYDYLLQKLENNDKVHTVRSLNKNNCAEIHKVLGKPMATYQQWIQGQKESPVLYSWMLEKGNKLAGYVEATCEDVCSIQRQRSDFTGQLNVCGIENNIGKIISVSVKVSKRILLLDEQ